MKIPAVWVGTYDFACRSAACRPPTSGGTGGSSAKGGSSGTIRGKMTSAELQESAKRNGLNWSKGQLKTIHGKPKPKGGSGGATGVGGGTRDVPLAKRDRATPDEQATISERTKNFTKGVTSEINAGAKKPSHVSDEQWGHVRHSVPRASGLTISKTGDVTFYYGSKKVTSGWKVEKVTGGYSVTGTDRIAKTQAAAKRAVATQIIKATNSSQKTYIDTINRRIASQ